MPLDAQCADEATGVRRVYVKSIDSLDPQVYHCNCTERGQPDDASAQLDFCTAA